MYLTWIDILDFVEVTTEEYTDIEDAKYLMDVDDEDTNLPASEECPRGEAQPSCFQI